MSHRRRIYLAGPLGFSEIGQAELVRVLMELGYEVVDPFALAPTDEIERIARLTSLDAQRDAWRDLNLGIGTNNCKAIDACNALLTVLGGQDVDSGTAAEIGYAFARGKNNRRLLWRFPARSGQHRFNRQSSSRVFHCRERWIDCGGHKRDCALDCPSTHLKVSDPSLRATPIAEA